MAKFAELWLVALYVLSFGIALGMLLWYERKRAGRPVQLPRPATTPAEETAMEALFAMRGLIHQLGNNAHELALQFDLVLNVADEREQQLIRDRLRLTLHRFNDITHQVSQIDARLSGYVPRGPQTTGRPPHL
jgi:hypothetical protein